MWQPWGIFEPLIRHAERAVILILGNLRVPHAKKSEEWLNGREEQIEILYLPPFSPESNPA